jgi:hypothetical protein
MKQLLWALAVAIALVPVVNDVCALDCGLERPPACPLHQHAPEPCRHDHATARAGLVRANVDAPRPADPGVIVIAHHADLTIVSQTIAHADAPLTRPPGRFRPDVLRI